MRNRSRLELTATILRVAKEGMSSTKIMFNVYVSHTQLKEYLALLIHNGLLEYQKGKRIYLTTQKGLDFLHTYTQMNDKT
jgi:predicted transcriptional regulator